MTGKRLSMEVSIQRMTLGSGCRYLLGSVAQFDGVSQYAIMLMWYDAELGTSPGRLVGQGLAGLGDGIGIERALK